jgi:hypothetical protein
MAFPENPSNGDRYKNHVYNSFHQMWERFELDINDLFPVGMVYIQFPGQSKPEDLGWPGTWSNISNEYAGNFFRAEGGVARSFNGGEQDHALEDHNHSLSYGGSIQSANKGWRVIVDDDYDNAYENSNYINHPTFANVANETRPVNRTIRIWKRVS